MQLRTAGKEECEDWGRADLYKVPLHDSTGALVITLNCIGVDYIGDNDGGSYENVVPLFKEHGLKINQLLAPARGTVEILVGDNHAGFFPKPIKTVGDVIWAETFFGNILHCAHFDFFPHQSAEDVSLSSFIVEYISKSSASLMMTSSTVLPRMRHATFEAWSGHACTSKISWRKQVSTDCANWMRVQSVLTVADARIMKRRSGGWRYIDRVSSMIQTRRSSHVSCRG
jgi:hypothetical protein